MTKPIAKSKQAESPQGTVSTRLLSSRVKAQARLLLDQQMWCWGRDIVEPQGNLLSAFGGAYHSCPLVPKTSSRYEWIGPGRRSTESVQVVLWAFGLIYAEGDRSVYVRRHGFDPKLCLERIDISGHWSPDGLTAWRAPRSPAATACCRELIAGLCAWIAQYEAWIQAVEGVRHRELVLAAWKTPVCTAGETSGAWLELAAAIRSAL
jgi:hypothetical protein